MIYLLLIGCFGGCAFWVYAAFKILYRLFRKRNIKSKAEFKRLVKKYEPDEEITATNVVKEVKNSEG